jgi:Ulp1 family protease
MIKRNKNKLGIVLNTDPHYKDGEHWISMFVNIKKKFIVYFDSNGNEPPNQVKKLIRTIEDQGKQLGIDFKVYINEREHQKTDSECGMYCLYFIIQMLKDKDVTYFLENNIPDEEVYKLRNKYFNSE